MSVNQYFKQVGLSFTVIHDQLSMIVGRMQFPVASAVNASHGWSAKVKLENFNSQEYRILNAKIDVTSLVSETNQQPAATHLVKLHFPIGLKNSNNNFTT